MAFTVVLVVLSNESSCQSMHNLIKQYCHYSFLFKHYVYFRPGYENVKLLTLFCNIYIYIHFVVKDLSQLDMDIE